MIDYKTPVADILFALRHGAEAGRLPDWDDELAAEVVAQAGRFVDGEIAPLDPIADAEHATLENGRVRLPAAFGRAYAKFVEAGWPSIAADEAYGGQGLPHVLASTVSEMLSGACVTFQMILSLGQGAMRTIASHADDTQKAQYMPHLASGEWLATMCLSEPQAGSDLGLIRTTATPTPEGGYRLSGGKVFISGGDQDITGNVVHLVLARTPDAPPGVKGLSLFLCPAVLPDGSRNGVSVVRLEEKMGMHASPTCQMAFDDAEAEMVGGPGEGLARMFTMMNAERLDVAVQGVGLADVAAQRSLFHANERRQGRAPGSGEPVDLIHRHGDVRRMLLTQMALAQGCRALVYRTMVELELDEKNPLVSFLTPVCKAFVTDAAMQAADEAIQIHGGYGYCKEYRVEQILRDGRITRIYEGTNGIQAMTLAGRLLRIDNGAAPKAFAAHVEAAAQAATPDTAAALNKALTDWRQATDAILDQADPGMNATAYLRLTGLLAFAAAWSRLENHADQSPNPERTRTLATFVRDRMLPETAHLASECAIPPVACDDKVFAAD